MRNTFKELKEYRYVVGSKHFLKVPGLVKTRFAQQVEKIKEKNLL